MSAAHAIFNGADVRHDRRRAGLSGRERAVLDRANRIADVLDERFSVPGTSLRFGWDSIIGLIPVIGDFIGAGISSYLVFEAIRLGIGPGPILRMLVNIVIDWLVGLVPLADIILDVAYKSNVKNARILADALQSR